MKNYHVIEDRMYYWQLETEIGVRFSNYKKDYKGKGQDGITAAQKRKLHAMGVNTSGIVYKGQACKIIQVLEARRNNNLPSVSELKFGDSDEKHKYSGLVYRVKVIKPNGSTFSQQVFTNISNAEYHAGKVKPEFDVEIVSFHPKQMFEINGVYFLKKETAEELAKKHNAKVFCWIG